MIKNTADYSLDQQHRLDAKTQDQRMVREMVDGTGMSPWEAEVAVRVVREVYFQEPGIAPIRSGQIRYECVRSDQGAGKKIGECAMVSSVLTLCSPEDRELSGGSTRRRQQKLNRMCVEAMEQKGLLSQEDLAELLHCDVRTIRRDIAELRELEIVVPTRGQVKDIGPGVTHRAIAIRHWLDGKEPQEVARAIHHSLRAVERYLGSFCRVVYLARKGFATLQIAFTVGISQAQVRTCLDIYEAFRHRPGFKQRLAELDMVGAAHFEAGDQKKGALLPLASSKPIRRTP